MFATCTAVPDKAKAPHAYRWYIHIAAIKGVRRYGIVDAAPRRVVLVWSCDALVNASHCCYVFSFCSAAGTLAIFRLAAFAGSRSCPARVHKPSRSANLSHIVSMKLYIRVMCTF